VVVPEPADRASRLLLVEDDSAIAEMYSFALRARGYEVTTAGDGLRALELVRAAPFDLVLLDLLMPNLDGYGVLAALRERPLPEPVPVVVLTNLSEPSVLARARELGALDVRIKSGTTPTMLSRLVAEWLSLGG
jgi:CheY-like chemotaxis protein